MNAFILKQGFLNLTLESLRQGGVVTAQLELDGRFPLLIQCGLSDQSERDDIPGETGVFYFTEQRENEFVRHI